MSEVGLVAWFDEGGEEEEVTDGEDKIEGTGEGLGMAGDAAGEDSLGDCEDDVGDSEDMFDKGEGERDVGTGETEVTFGMLVRFETTIDTAVTGGVGGVGLGTGVGVGVAAPGLGDAGGWPILDSTCRPNRKEVRKKVQYNHQGQFLNHRIIFSGQGTHHDTNLSSTHFIRPVRLEQDIWCRYKVKPGKSARPGAAHRHSEVAAVQNRMLSSCCSQIKL